MRILLADDEPNDLLTLEKLLCCFEEVVVTGKVYHLTDLTEAMRENRPDVVFLDIRFPGQSGLQVVERIRRNGSEVVLVTAYEEFAVEAFRLRVLDYLLKPVQSRRLGETLETLRHRFTGTGVAGEPEFSLPVEGVWRRLPLYCIREITTEGNTTFLHLVGGKILSCRMPLYRVLERFPQGHDFRQINRRRAVPLFRVQALPGVAKGCLQLQMDEGEILTCSKRRSGKIRKELERQFGMTS